MKKRSHNKKRNVGIIYEQLLRTISKSLVEGDTKKANLVKSIIHNIKGKDKEKLFKRKTISINIISAVETVKKNII